MRLDKFLSEANVASRKAIKQMIKESRVKVDGVPARSPEQKIDEQASQVLVDGQEIRLEGRIVLMLHKPAGFVTSTSDPRDKTVMELLPARYQKLFPVGRLDKETEGLLLFTNDGDLGHRLTSPRHQVEKRYYAETDGQPDGQDAEAFRQGITLRDGTECLPAELEPFPGGCFVTVREGKYHQVRRMLASRGKTVTYLRREAEGGLTVGDLKPGQYRILREEEVINLL